MGWLKDIVGGWVADRQAADDPVLAPEEIVKYMDLIEQRSMQQQQAQMSSVDHLAYSAQQLASQTEITPIPPGIYAAQMNTVITQPGLVADFGGNTEWHMDTIHEVDMAEPAEFDRISRAVEKLHVHD